MGYETNIHCETEYSFSIFRVSNTFATIPGIAGVYITGYLKEATGGWEAAFILGAGTLTTSWFPTNPFLAVEVSALYSFMIWGSAERIDFDPPTMDDQIYLENTESTTNEMGGDRSPFDENSHLASRKGLSPSSSTKTHKD